MDIVSGQNQVGSPGAELPAPLVVKVVNSVGAPISNQIVNFRVVDGGGSAYAGASLTNTDGLAQERWTLGPTAGAPQKVEARAVDATNGQKLVFATFTATAADQTQLIATVTVTPATPSRVVGATVQLTATARNASGTTLSGKVFTWSSNNSAVATVSASGLVTASSAGTATITASSEGKNGTATITVNAAPPPPPPTQPDTIFYDGFESGNLNAWTDGQQPNQFTVVTDATLAYAGSRLLRMNVPANGAGGHLAHFFMPGYDSVFVRLHVRYAANWTSNTYVALIRGSRTDDEYSSFGVGGQCPNGTDWFATNVTTTGAGNPGASQFYSYWVGMPKEANGVTCLGRFGNGNETYFAQASMARDVWHRVEFWVKLNTPGQSNSVQKMWIDGQLRGEWNGLNFRTTSDLRLNSLSILAYPETSSSTARTLYYDEIVVSGLPLPGSFELPPPPPPPAPVATVTVSPASVTLNAGTTQQLSATLRDASGTLLTGRTVTWSSNNTSVATVSAAGLASAIAAGSATITATSEGMSGASSVTVAAPPPPPSQVDTVFYEGFESGNLNAWTDGQQPTQFTVVTNATGAFAGTRMLRMNVPANGAGGHLAHFFMPGYDSVFVRLHVRYATNWTGNTYVALVRGSRTDDAFSSFGVAGQCPNGSDWFATNLTTVGSGNPGASQFYTYWVGMPKEADGVTCYGRFGTGNTTYYAQPTMTRNVWHRVEFWIKLNTPGQTNSVQKMWIDGQLRGEWTGLNFRTTTNLKLNSLTILAYPDSPSGALRQIFYDEILVTTKPVVITP